MTLVRTAFDGENLWVTIDNPPVNATSTGVRAGLLDAVAEANSCGARRAVLRAAGRTFVAGGDVTEFDRPPEEPHLPDVVNAIETSDVPFLALLHGTVLGGGFEIAMASAWRIAAPGTRFGLPEVNLGLVPGAGGSQRAPRLIGWPMAIDMTCRGKMITAEAMRDAGGIDAIAGDLDRAATDFDEPRPIPVSDRPAPPIDAATWDKHKAGIAKAARGQASPLHALEALGWARLPFEAGQPRERALHLELRGSDESRALRHAFFAERAVTRPDAIKGADPRDIHRIAVVGGGLMGAGIAMACLMAGHSVDLIERDGAAAAAARTRIDALLDGAKARGKLDATTRASTGAALATHAGYDAAAAADLAIEAVFEDVSVKAEVFAALAARMRPDAILATNTSYLDPRMIFAGIPGQARCLGLHFFSPAHIMKLVEVVRLPDTGADVLSTGFALAKRLRKTPVLSGICDGFIGNRILAAYRREAEYLLVDGALPHEVDAAMRGFGMAMGPFEAQDMTGLQIAWANRQRLAPTRPAGERYEPISDRLCEMGRLGQRAGKGWYRYEDGDRTPHPDDGVAALLEARRAETGRTRQSFAPEEITARLLAVMANEGARIVEEGIAEDAAAVDVVKLLGYGFPRWRGGPMHYALTQGDAAVAETLHRIAAASPGSWTLANRYRTG